MKENEWKGYAVEDYLRESCLRMYRSNELWLGDIRNEVLEPGYVRNSVVVPAKSGNFYGFAFGGFLMSLVDVAACCVPWTYGKYVVTQSADIHFIKSAKVGERIVAEARSIHHGTTSSVADVRITGEDGVLRLSATVTMHIVGDIAPDDFADGAAE